jgi:hypothetical protein
MKEDADNVKSAWGCMMNDGKSARKATDYRKAEKLILQKLPSVGFSNIVHCNAINGTSTGDIKAEKDSELCLVEVTLGISHRIHRHIEFCKMWKIPKIVVVYVSRDMHRMRIKNIDVDTYSGRSSSLTRDEVYSESELMIDGIMHSLPLN